jgi:hypothetical protein
MVRKNNVHGRTLTAMLRRLSAEVRNRGCRARKTSFSAYALPIAVLLIAATPAFAAQPLDNRALLNCAAITNDHQRLKCFDAITRRARPDGSPAIPARASHDAPGPPAYVATPVEDSPSAATTGPRFRIAAGPGFGVGDHTGSFRVLTGHVDLQSAVGGSGILISGQVWIDRWIGENWTLGVEYVAFRNEGVFRAALPPGASGLSGATVAGARARIGGDLAFLNVAWRQASGSVHPYIGGGFGIGYGHASAGFDFNNAALGSLAQVEAIGSPIAGVQGFAGVEFDLGPHAYLAVMPKVIVVDGHPIGVDQRYMDFGVNGVLGWRF